MYIVYICIYCIYCWFPFPHFILNFTRMKLISSSGRRGQTLALSWTKTRVFFEKHIENKHLCRTDNNFHYLCKSNIAVINLIVGSRNMIEVL